MADDEYEEEEEIDIDAIDDEQTLIEMLDETEDFDERKRIRDRLMKVQHEIRAKRAEIMKKREEERDQRLKQKVKEADDKKKRTLNMYDQMAKSAPAGAKKVMDANIYKYNDATSRPDSPAPGDQPKDLVEDAIRNRAKEADLRKKRILAAYDHAAKCGPAGPKIVYFDSFKRADVSNYTPPSPGTGFSCTFGMSGGVPQNKIEKAPMTPVSDMDKPTFGRGEEDLDPMERAIRARKKEADDRKRRTLAAYDIVAKTGPVGPKTVVLEEFRDLEINRDGTYGKKVDTTASFHAGVPIAAGGKR